MLALEHTSLYLQGAWATVLDSAWSGLAARWLVHTWDTLTLQFSLLGQADFVPSTANSKTLFSVSLATGTAIVCRPPQKHTSPLQPQHPPLSSLFARVPLQLPDLAIPQPQVSFPLFQNQSCPTPTWSERLLVALELLGSPALVFHESGSNWGPNICYSNRKGWSLGSPGPTLTSWVLAFFSQLLLPLR